MKGAWGREPQGPVLKGVRQLQRILTGLRMRHVTVAAPGGGKQLCVTQLRQKTAGSQNTTER